MRPTFSSEKNSAGDVTPALTRANPSIASWLPCTAPSTCCISGGGGSSVASCAPATEHHRRLTCGAIALAVFESEELPRVGYAPELVLAACHEPGSRAADEFAHRSRDQHLT